MATLKSHIFPRESWPIFPLFSDAIFPNLDDRDCYCCCSYCGCRCRHHCYRCCCKGLPALFPGDKEMGLRSRKGIERCKVWTSVMSLLRKKIRTSFKLYCSGVRQLGYIYWSLFSHNYVKKFPYILKLCLGQDKRHTLYIGCGQFFNRRSERFSLGKRYFRLLKRLPERGSRSPEGGREVTWKTLPLFSYLSLSLSFLHSPSLSLTFS